MSRWVEPLLGFARRTAEQGSNAGVGHRQPGAVVEIAQVEPEGAVLLDVDQMVEDQLARYRGSP